jgi:DNA repair exonuclease SbcCD ATPase subunit
MRLTSLTLHNFQGIKDFALDTQGCDINVFGDNRTGKTTLFNAFLWVLFDKNANNRKNFEIKTLDKHGEALHHLDHEVEAVLDIDGKSLTLRKVYSEKWTKKRGSATQEFGGHTTDYYIDGVPTQKKEYDARISSIADENIFRLLTNPLYFNECMKWQDCRNLLMEVCGNISDQDVIASDKALARLPEILGSHSQDDYKKIVVARRAEINKELTALPVRIDEATRSLSDITDLIIEELPADIAKLKAMIQEQQQNMARITSGGEIAEKKRQAAEIDLQLLEILRADRQGIEEQIQAKQRDITEATGKLAQLNTDIRNDERFIEQDKAQVARLEAKMVSGRAEWKEINSPQFLCEDAATVCPACDQSLPEEKLQTARDKAIADFNLRKSRLLEENMSRGKAAKAETERLNGEVAALTRNIEAAKDLREQIEGAVALLTVDLEALRQQSTQHTGGPAYDARQNDKFLLEQEIAQLQAGNTEAIAKVQQEVADLNADLDTLHRSQASIKNNEMTEKRILQLKEQEHTLATEFEKLEGELFLCDQFTRAKVEMLESKINSKFKMARFKLFDVQINSGLAETCLTTFDGVSYPDLNHEAQINVGLDVISTLIEHYGFSAPVFVDNAEAVTKLINIPAQMIRLVVSAEDRVLRVA